MNDQQQMIFYISGLSIIGVVTIWLALRWLKGWEEQRIHRLRQAKLFDAVETESPVENSQRQQRKRGISSVEDRFSFLKRVLVPGLTLTLVTLIALPFLESAPTIYVTLIASLITVIVGFAAKPFIENLIAGIVIMIARPVRIGDTLTIDGHYGSIERIDMLYTVIKVWNWRRYVIPNHRLLQKEFENHTLYDSYEWSKVEFFVTPDANIAEVETLALDAMRQSPNLASVEEPTFWVMGIEKEAIRCWVAGWAISPPEMWDLCHDTRKNLLIALNHHQIALHRYNSAPTSVKAAPSSLNHPGTSEAAISH